MASKHCICGINVKQQNQATLGECTTTCSGDASVKCGGHYRYSVYTIAGCPTAATTTTSASNSNCVIEENIKYDGGGNDLNNGQASPRQNDAASCQSYCKSNYPAANYFEWHSTSSSAYTMHKICYCKATDAGKSPANWGGTFAGEVDCGGELCSAIRQNLVHLYVR